MSSAGGAEAGAVPAGAPTGAGAPSRPASEFGWSRYDFDDADDDLTASLARLLRSSEGEPLACSGDVFEAVGHEGAREEAPDAVWDVCEQDTIEVAYRLYVAAGMQVAVTNTAGCDPWSIEASGVSVPFERVVERAVRAARSAAPPFVAGLLDVGGMPPQESAASGARLLGELAHQGVHAFVVSGATDEASARGALSAARAANEHLYPSRPVVASLDARALAGVDVREARRLLAGMVRDGACVVGFDHVGAADARRLAPALSEVWREFGRRGYLQLCVLDERGGRVRGGEAAEGAAQEELLLAARSLADAPLALVGFGEGVTPALAANIQGAWL